jgi:SEC-C motif-containing protein
MSLKKIGPNHSCPCGSGNKYKKCCQPYHKGAQPKDALTLMKSRYSAYAANQSDYIIQTTHPDNTDYSMDIRLWRDGIELFCQDTDFLGLEIHKFIDGDSEAFVTFCAMLDSGDMVEKSHFIKLKGRWLYLDGVFV